MGEEKQNFWSKALEFLKGFGKWLAIPIIAIVSFILGNASSKSKEKEKRIKQDIKDLNKKTDELKKQADESKKEFDDKQKKLSDSLEKTEQTLNNIIGSKTKRDKEAEKFIK